MKCTEVQLNLSAYIYGELNLMQVKKIHKHLGRCESCLKLEMQLEKTFRFMNQMRLDALPKNFDENLERKLQREKRKNIKTHHQSRKIIFAIAASIILFLAVNFLIRDAFSPRVWTKNLSNYRMPASVFGSVNQSDYPSRFRMLKNQIN